MTTFTTIICCQCNEPFGMAPELYRTARARGPDFTFYCPHGHGQVFSKGESEAEKLRRERDRLKQDQAWYEQRLKEERQRTQLAERRTAAAKGQITKLKKRAAGGVCPCCNRTFQDLARHMAGQHPNFVAEPDASEHIH